MEILFIICFYLSISLGIFSLIIFTQAFRKAVYNLPMGIIAFVIFWGMMSNVLSGISFMSIEYSNQIQTLLSAYILRTLVLICSYLALLSMTCIRFSPDYQPEDYQCVSLQEVFLKCIQALRYLPRLAKQLFD